MAEFGGQTSPAIHPCSIFVHFCPYLPCTLCGSGWTKMERGCKEKIKKKGYRREEEIRIARGRNKFVG